MAAAVGLVVSVGAAPAGAVTVTPPGSSCHNRAFVEYSYIDGADPYNQTEQYVTTSDINGVGCYWRKSSTVAKVSFNWAAVGHLYAATMEMQLRDCTTKTWAHRVPLDYPNGTRKGVTAGGISRTWTIKPHHKYRLRIWGTGSYARRAYGVYGGVGHFYASGGNYNPVKKKHWKDWGGTGCV